MPRPYRFCCIVFVLAAMVVPVHAATLSAAQCAAPLGIPTPPAGAATIAPGAGGDDTARIQQALDQLTSGKWLVFQPGTYQISQHLMVSVTGVTLYGAGATLNSTSPTDGGLMILGDNVAVYSFTLAQASTSRQSTPWSGGIAVYDDRSGVPRRVLGSVIANNTVNDAAAAGIFLFKASSFTVAGNRVYRSWADGIHMTGGSREGRVVHNTVTQTGDDMIAVVSYAGPQGTMTASARYANWSAQQDELDSDIYIGSNVVSDQYWGRGISVVGGSHVTIENNSISNTATGAGIYLTRETAYSTFGDHDILVRNNQISNVQTAAPTYMPAGFVPTQTHQGGIEIASQMTDDELSNALYATAFSVSNVSLAGNQISNTRYDGIRAGAYSPANMVSQVVIQNNVLTSVGNTSIVDEYSGFALNSGVCAGNTLGGVSWSTQCVKSALPVGLGFIVPGASVQCDITGHINVSAATRPSAPVLVTVR